MHLHDHIIHNHLHFHFYLQLHLQVLGKLLLKHRKDNRLHNAVMALASIPDLFLLINSLVRRTHALLDGDHLNFIFAHTNILNLENKLIVARRMISAINHQDNPLEHVRNGRTYEHEHEYNGSYDVAYPIIEWSPCPNAHILLSRNNPWKSLFFFTTGFTDSTGLQSHTFVHAIPQFHTNVQRHINMQLHITRTYSHILPSPTRKTCTHAHTLTALL